MTIGNWQQYLLASVGRKYLLKTVTYVENCYIICFGASRHLHERFPKGTKNRDRVVLEHDPGIPLYLSFYFYSLIHLQVLIVSVQCARDATG